MLWHGQAQPCRERHIPKQLDILAIEPFYGGGRRHMLDTLTRCSRHRWNVLKLPARRIERRLSAAAQWFAEILQRHSVGSVDVLFTSEAINLAEFYRLVPNLARKPSIVYFHENELPDPRHASGSAVELVNLITGAAAEEVWFNSLYHLKTFLGKATALVNRYTELSGSSPLPELTRKAQLVHPPVDLDVLRLVREQSSLQRDPRTIILEAGGSDLAPLKHLLGVLKRREERFTLLTLGNPADIPPEIPHTPIDPSDETAEARAALEAGLFISLRHGATADYQAVRAMVAGCWPLLPDQGVYPELLPPRIHRQCLYDGSGEGLTARVLDAWYLDRPEQYEDELLDVLSPFEPISACAAMDERLDRLHGHPARPLRTGASADPHR
jgi:hypothetical protein